jgi:hypothetical protein
VRHRSSGVPSPKGASRTVYQTAYITVRDALNPAMCRAALFLALIRGIYLNMTRDKKNTTGLPSDADEKPLKSDLAVAETSVPVERNGPKGPEPTRYGDWEQKGRCSDF